MNGKEIWTDDVDDAIITLIEKILVPDDQAKKFTSTIKLNLENTVLPIIGHSYTLEPFGSSVYALMSTKSDIDFCLISPHTKSIRDTRKLLNKIGDRLRESNLFSGVICLPACKIPLVKFVHNMTDKRCELSFDNKIALKRTSLMKIYVENSEDLKNMVSFLRYLLQKNNLFGTNKMTTTVLFWLVVYYMQQSDGMLPAVEKVLRQNPDEQKRCFTAASADDEFSLYFHLTTFLKFYSDFDFQKFVISPYKARTFPIADYKTNDFSVSGVNLEDPLYGAKECSPGDRNVAKCIHRRTARKFQHFLRFLRQLWLPNARETEANRIAVNGGVTTILLSEWNDVLLHFQVTLRRAKCLEDFQRGYRREGIKYVADTLEMAVKEKFNECEIERTDAVDGRGRSTKTVEVVPTCFLLCFGGATRGSKRNPGTEPVKSIFIKLEEGAKKNKSTGRRGFRISAVGNPEFLQCIQNWCTRDIGKCFPIK